MVVAFLLFQEEEEGAAATRTKKNDDPGKAPCRYVRPSSFVVIA